MELTVSIRAEEGYLCVIYAGKFTLASAQRTFLEILEGIRQSKVGKVLVDGREITGELSTLDRYLYGAFMADAVGAQLERDKFYTKFSYVLAPPVLDPGRLGETVAVNRGVCAKVFDNLDDAIEWLGINSAGKTAERDG